MSSKKIKAVYYNIRIVDLGRYRYQVGYVSRLRESKGGGGTWVRGSINKIRRLLIEGQLVD